MTTKIPVPVLCRLEHLTPQGWASSGADVNLFHPERYPERLRQHGKFGRCTELDSRLAPTGKVWVSDDVPEDPSVLVRTGEGNVPWKLPDPATTCPFCGDPHRLPHSGACLL